MAFLSNSMQQRAIIDKMCDLCLMELSWSYRPWKTDRSWTVGVTCWCFTISIRNWCDQWRTINTSSNILKGTMFNACTFQHSIPRSILVHLCDLSKEEGGKKRKCVKTTLKGVNIIWINEAISLPVVNSHHLDN